MELGRFNRKERYEWPSQYYWTDLQDVHMLTPSSGYRNTIVTAPNMALEGITPTGAIGRGYIADLLLARVQSCVITLSVKLQTF